MAWIDQFRNVWKPYTRSGDVLILQHKNSPDNYWTIINDRDTCAACSADVHLEERDTTFEYCSMCGFMICSNCVANTNDNGYHVGACCFWDD